MLETREADCVAGPRCAPVRLGDRAKLAQALLTITGLEQPPLRFIAGADAIEAAEQKLAERQGQIDAFRELSTARSRRARDRNEHNLAKNRSAPKLLVATVAFA